ncbi:ATP-citrate synthase [Thelohanellus kitauei]|uniref:ATP-citrate synthase n=1 Tax=Thelohanellus kitauei TaxID=669202 RepID=A0A0C2MWM6_THEKT|nr:ATP-citrate synthase [Thelohanellus kitauei]
MISSLCSGLLSIGDRFGGAINGAANQFWNAYRSNKTPSEFVQEMRKKGELILGIGHLIKSVTNPDHRVQKLIEFVKKRQPTPLLDYALEVEKITTSKKSNLILNVDGTIAVSLIDMMLHSNYFSEDDVQNYIKIGAFNSIFILSRTIGFIGHYIDQKRLKQGLYRHPWDDILFMTGLDINKK